MVTPSALQAAVAAVIEALPRDGRYSVDDANLSHTWTVSPDPESRGGERDLLARVSLGGCDVAGKGIYRQRMDVGILTACYSGVRFAYLSQEPLQAEDRIHGAAQHILEALSDAPLPVQVYPTGYSDPEITQDGLWYLSVVSFLLTLTR